VLVAASCSALASADREVFELDAIVSNTPPTPGCRDLKTSNILLSAEGVAKIADVGLAKMLTNADQYSLDHTAGTFAYAAPELILGTRCSEKVRGLAARCPCATS